MDGTIERTHNYPMVVCPHCGREVPAAMTDAHASVCIHRPEMKARILAALTTDVPGVGARQKEYDTARVVHGAAHATTLLRAYGGTWTAVLDAFGLTPWVSASRRAARTPAQRRMTRQQREDAAIADVAAMAEDARQIMAAEYDDAHTLRGCAVRDLPGLTICGRPCVAVMLR